MTETIPELTRQEADVLSRWDAAPLVTGEQARYLIGVLRAALLALAEAPPHRMPSGAPVDAVAAQEWYTRRTAAFQIAREISSPTIPPTTLGGL